MESLRSTFIVNDECFKTPDRQLQAIDLWRRLTSSGQGLVALERKVRAVVGTKPTAVVVNGFDNFLAVVQLLNWYAYEFLDVHGILYNMQLTKSGFLHIARAVRQYSSFEIGIEDIVIAAMDLLYLHFAGLRSAKPRPPVNNVERIERLLGGFRYPIERDAEHVEWSTELGVNNEFLTSSTAQQLGIATGN